MDTLPTWLLVAGALAILFVALAALRRRRRGARGERVSGDMIERQRRAVGAPRPAHAPRLDRVDPAAAGADDPLAVPEIRAAIVAGNKIEAIKLARERFGLGLREAKELVERHS